MQRPDERKRQQILRAAARLFAAKPFHKVKLDDLAASAAVGKGTLYVYFESKEDLYCSLIYEGFGQLVDRLTGRLGGAGGAGQDPRESLREICREIVGFGFANPNFFEVVRAAGGALRHPKWEAKRRDLTGLIERTIRRGVAAGAFDDAHPEITAVCVPGLIRSIMLYSPRGAWRQDVVAEQIVRWVERGVGVREGGAKSRPGGRVINRRKGTRKPARSARRSGR